MSFDLIDRKFGRDPAPTEAPPEDCPRCFDAGWLLVNYGGRPVYELCEGCFNPHNRPRP